MRDIPVVNALIDGPNGGDTIMYRAYVDNSVAVATEKGLVTPVVRNVETLDMVGIEKGLSCWFYYFLTYLGLYRPRLAKLPFVGLDNAGKSSLLQDCANNLPGSVVTTSHPGSEKLIKGNVSFTAFDVSGHHQNRELWINNICGALAIIFMVDAKAAERLDEAAAELHALSVARAESRLWPQGMKLR